MKLKYLIFPIILLGCNQSFADFQRIISTYGIAPKRSQQEFNIALNKIETANFHARLNLEKAYYAYRRDPHGYNNASCTAMQYAEAFKKLVDYNPLYASQNTKNDMANSLVSTYAFTQNARCPQRVASELPAAKLGSQFYKTNLSQESLEFIATYFQKKQSLPNLESNTQYLQFLCETKEHFSKLTDAYLKNEKKLAQRDYLSYQSYEFLKREAIDILKRNNLEFSCVNGKLKLPVSAQPAYSYSSNNQLSSYDYKLENKAPEPVKPTISTEQKTCAVINILLRSADKNLGTAKCN